MKNLYLLLAVLLYGSAGYSQCITNGDFEAGNLTGYTFSTVADCTIDLSSCNVDTSGFVALTPSGTVNNATSLAALTSGLTTYDTTLSGVQVPVVHSGTYGVRLNNTGLDCSITTMSRVITPASTSVSFWFSLIVQNAHSDIPADNAFFSVRLYDAAGQMINTNEVCINADPANPIYDQDNNGLLYSGWQCGRINMPEEYIGESVRIEFIVTDCGQGGHFGKVYIDDISCDTACSEPAFGLLELDPIQYGCQSETFNVCGTYLEPIGGTLDGLELTILHDGNVFYTSSSPASAANGVFCFAVDPAIFAGTASGQYDLSVTGTFDMGNFNLTMTDNSSVLGTDLYTGVDIAQSYVVVNELYWDDIADSYELEFTTDGSCCPPADGMTPGYYNVTVTDNHIDLATVSQLAGGKCFRWRIKAGGCSQWSQWCCLAYDFNNTFENANWGNPLADCYEGDSCPDYLFEDTNVTSFTVDFEQYEIGITAVNTIQANATAIYQAGLFVEMTPGFHSANASDYIARIVACDSAVERPSTERKAAKKYNENEVVSKYEKTAVVQPTDITIYPNPANDKVSIDTGATIYNIFVITDISGKELIKVYNNDKADVVELNLSSLTPGVYLVYADGVAIDKLLKN
jgi:Secretion system C-terminal sorting domain